MDKKYLECLAHIIEIERTCYTQEKLIDSLEKKINILGVPKKINQPQMMYTNIQPVRYNQVAVPILDIEDVKVAAFIGGIIGGVFGGIIGFLFGNILGTIFSCIIIGAIAGAVYENVKFSNKKSKADSANENALKEAQVLTNKLAKEQKHKDEEKYRNEMRKYQALLDFEDNRLSIEGEKKKELLYSREELINKHKETKELLNKFYDFADIYETYRNIVAICYIYEYLKSGVCEQLTGRDGAYMIFKYEMYEKLKIERLDTIASKLEQLHFDNITLNNTMEKISIKCDNLINEISDMRIAQIEAAERNEALINNLGNRIDSAADCIAYKNSVIAYNQECAINELKQIKWLSVMEG